MRYPVANILVTLKSTRPRAKSGFSPDYCTLQMGCQGLFQLALIREASIEDRHKLSPWDTVEFHQGPHFGRHSGISLRPQWNITRATMEYHQGPHQNITRGHGGLSPGAIVEYHQGPQWNITKGHSGVEPRAPLISCTKAPLRPNTRAPLRPSTSAPLRLSTRGPSPRKLQTGWLGPWLSG